MKLKNEALEREKVLAEQAIVPLKKENERVVHENNDLHREIMTVKETLEASDLKWRGKENQTSSELEDVKFVVRQKDIKIKDLETEILSLKESLCANPDGSSGIEMSSALNAQGLPPSDARPALGEATDAKHWAEELRKSDEMVADLRA